MHIRALARVTAEHEIWPLATVVAASIVTERALPFALIVAAFLFSARWIARGTPSVRTPIDWPILGLAVMGGISLIVTVRMDLTAPQIGRLLLGLAFYYGLVNWASSLRRLDLVSLGLATSGLVLAIGAPFGVVWEYWKFTFIPASIYQHFVRLSSDTINPNVMAGYLALLLPCVAAPLLFAWGQLVGWRKLLYSVVLAAMLVVLVLTQSRAGVFAAVVSILVLAVLRWDRAWVIIGGLVTVGVLVGFASYSQIVKNISLAGVPERIDVWSRSWEMMRDHAFTGIGMGSFTHFTSHFYPLMHEPNLPHAHNLFLQVAIDLGIPGLVAWLAALGTVIAAAWATYRRNCAVGNMAVAGMAAGLLAAQVVLVIHGMFDAVTWGMVRPAVLIWALWGAAVAARRIASA